MRPMIVALAATAALLGAPLAHAAPACVDRSGDMIRCGTPGAMPVGWSPSPEQQARRLAKAEGPSPRVLFAGISLVVALMGLIALMPDFDGWGGAWDPDEAEKQRGRGA